MDLSKLNQLDPKLKETYERVMGTSARPTPVAPQPTIQNQTIQSQPTQPQPMPQPVQQARPQPIAQPQPVQAQPIQKQQEQTLKKKIKILPVFIILGGIIFLLGYVLFWTKIFNLKLPFLPF